MCEGKVEKRKYLGTRGGESRDESWGGMTWDGGHVITGRALSVAGVADLQGAKRAGGPDGSKIGADLGDGVVLKGLVRCGGTEWGGGRSLDMGWLEGCNGVGDLGALNGCVQRAVGLTEKA